MTNLIFPQVHNDDVRPLPELSTRSTRYVALNQPAINARQDRALVDRIAEAGARAH